MLSSKVLWRINLIPSTLSVVKRSAGHSKWANIRHTKAANDSERAQLILRKINAIRVALSGSGWVTDPASNIALARAIESAHRAQVPKETIENALKKMTANKERSIEYRLKGPNDCIVIITYSMQPAAESELRNLVKRILKNSKVLQITSGFNNAFEKKGIIVAKHPSKEATMDDAEEAAILGGADEVSPNEDKDLQTYRFLTEAPALWPATKYLRENGWDILEASHEDLPLYLVEVPEEQLQEVLKDVEKLQDFPEYLKTVDNIA